MTEHSPSTGVTTVRLVGELTLASAPECRSSIAEAAAECPVAVIVDLSELRHRAEESLLAAFAAATFKARETWAVPVRCTEPFHFRAQTCASAFIRPPNLAWSRAVS